MSPTQTTAEAVGNRFIRRKGSAKKLDISVATLDRWVREGRICKPTKLGPRASGWAESYLDSLIAGTAKQTSTAK